MVIAPVSLIFFNVPVSSSALAPPANKVAASARPMIGRRFIVFSWLRCRRKCFGPESAPARHRFQADAMATHLFDAATLGPTFRSSYTFSAITFYELRKAMGTSKFMILVPLFDLQSLGSFRRLRCRDFKSAALGPTLNLHGRNPGLASPRVWRIHASIPD